MKLSHSAYLFLFISNLLFPYILNSQQSDAYATLSFDKVRERYMEFEENDENAFKYVNTFIKKAKQERNYHQLARAYIDAIYFSKTNKLIYADSSIWASKKTKDEEFIARSYLAKGSVYYFNNKQYQNALNEYLSAHRQAEKIKDKYLKNRIDYHLAIVKGYLGYNEEALTLLDACIDYFEKEFKDTESDENTRFNHQKGYLNSIHQSINFQYNLNHYKKVDSLIQVGLAHTPSTDEFALEQSYFYKWKGIRLYDEKEYTNAISLLKASLQNVDHVNDFAQASIINFYLGMSYIESGNNELGHIYLNKIDSIFNKNHFILPELRKTYEILIDYNKEKKDLEKQLYYTNQLLKADDFFISDFRYLSQKISKEYDTHKLKKEKEILISKNKQSSNALLICSFLIFVLLIILYYQYKKAKTTRANYSNLIRRIQLDELDQVNEVKPEIKSLHNTNLLTQILQKLAHFETTEKFLDSNLTQAKLASILKTNTSYLSQIINEYKGTNFTQYINTLRINYITKLLYKDKMYLNHSIEALAEKAGFSSRQVFSNVFYKINKVRPKDFITNRKKELQGQIFIHQKV